MIGIFKALWFLIKLPFGKKKGAGFSQKDRQHILEKRLEIERLVSSENAIELKHAVMEADKLVDYALKSKGYEGETFADRLRSAERNIDHATYQSIWEGHKVRNQLAHETSDIPKETLRLAVKRLLNYLRIN